MRSHLLLNSCIALGVSSKRILANVALPSVAGLDFEAFLRTTAEEIIDCAVRELVDEEDRIVFEEEALDVTA
jgi:hypothetical protein